MYRYRDQLPQLSDRLFLTDGGLETTLVFEKGYDLPEFAAFDVLRREGGAKEIEAYYLPYIRLAHENKTGFILESPTWRASRDWGRKIGYDSDGIKQVNQRSIQLLADIRRQYETQGTTMVISGCIGPYSDGYTVSNKLSAVEAKDYHEEQIHTLSQTDADMVTAFTLNYSQEAIGIASAARSEKMPVAIGFTVETDGRLPSGQSLAEAISEVDRSTHGAPAYYMINCAHPTHFDGAFAEGDEWLQRIRAIRANASAKSHAELDAAEELDAGDPDDLGRQYAHLQAKLPHLSVIGGCCGTDHRHLEAICRSVTIH